MPNNIPTTHTHMLLHDLAASFDSSLLHQNREHFWNWCEKRDRVPWVCGR